MAKRKSFADDGWAVWIGGDDTSTLYLNEWVDPRGKNYVDVAIRIRGVQVTQDLNVFIPYTVEASEIQDLSGFLREDYIFRAIFNTRCVMDFMKNPYTSELAYHGKTVDLVHIANMEYTVKPLANGTLVTLQIQDYMKYLDNDEAYLLFRLPHKNLDRLFEPHRNVKSLFSRLRDLVTSPVMSEKYSCSVRVNEARLLPDEINQLRAFHRQKLNKTVVTVSVHEDYQVNDANCYRIHRMERELYANYAPAGFDCDDVVTYEWNESRERNLYGHFNFYFGIARESISRGSMMIYMVLLLLVGLLGDVIAFLLGIS